VRGPIRKVAMSVIIIREMVGTSPTRGRRGAPGGRRLRARSCIRSVGGESTAVVENGEIVEYQVELRIGFEYEG
jgi:flavin-binding protein dodecin